MSKRKITGKRSIAGEHKQPQIRWRKRDLELIERTINNFNKRLYRQQKKNDGTVMLPERRSKSKAVKEIKTRGEFNQFISDLESFTAKTAKPVKIDKKYATQWEVDKVRREESEYAVGKKSFKDYLGGKEIFEGGKPTGNIKKYSFISDKEASEVNTLRDPQEMKDEAFMKFRKWSEQRLLSNYKSGKERAMVENYIKGLMRVGYSDDLIMMIGTIPPEKFLEIIETDTMAEFDFIYDPIELTAREEQIRNAFAPYTTDTQYIDFYDIMDIAELVQERIHEGYYGRHYENEHRKYRWKKRR